MKIERLQGSEVSFEILKEGEEFAQIKGRIVAKFKNAKVDGFRKGHVPLDVIEKTFANDIRDEILNEVISKEYNEILKNEDIRPIAELQVTELKFEKDSLFVKLQVAVFPQFEVANYKGLNIELEKAEVSDEEVEAQIKLMADRSKKFEKVDREVAEDGDIAIINFEGFVDGVAFDGGKAENHRLELGSKTFIDNFEAQIVGHKIGEEFDVNVNFPEQYHAENLKGKPAVFKVKLNGLEAPVLPELNDEFAKANGVDNMQDLRNSIKGNILSSKEEAAKGAKLSKILETIADATEMEVPAIAVENEINSHLNRFNQQLQMQGMNLETYTQMTGNSIDKMREDLRENAAKGVKVSFVVSKIAELENINVSDEEFNEELNRVASLYGMTVDALNKELEKSNGVDRFYHQVSSQIFITKVNNYLLENN